MCNIQTYTGLDVIWVRTGTMKLKFQSGTGSAMPFGFDSGAKTGQIVVDSASGIYKSLQEVEAEINRLKTDLDDILEAARVHFGIGLGWPLNAPPR